VNVYRILGLALLLSGCGGGGGGAASSCNAVRGEASCDAAAGGCDNESASNDGDLTSFARISTGAAPASLTATRGLSDDTFPTGSNVGIFVTPPSGFSSADITLSTVQGQERAVVESATGPTLTVTPTSGDPAANYISFTATAPFNGLKVTVNELSSDDYLVFEFCGSATVR
jgi:hypothetical protein